MSPITHAKVSAVSDGSDTSLVRPSDWNADHVGASGAVGWLSWVAGVGVNGGGGGNDAFLTPYGIAKKGDNLFVADTGNMRIFKRLASDLTFVSKIGSWGTGNDQFFLPAGITTDGVFVYVTDAGNNRIVKRNVSDLAFVSKIGTSGTGNDHFSYPTGITTDGTHLWIADLNNNRIVKRLCSDLSYVSQIGTTGTGNDQFNFIGFDNADFAGVDNDGTYLWVADPGNHRVVKRLMSDLSYVAQVGTEGVGNGQFFHPKAVSTQGGWLWVSDSDNHRLVKLRVSDLAYVGTIGSGSQGVSGSSDLDQFSWPKSVVSDGTYLWVADEDNDRISKWLIDPTNKWGQSAIIASEDLAIANTETVVTAKVFAANELVAGMVFRFEAWFTKAGTQAAAAIIRIRIGTTTLTGTIMGTLTTPNEDTAVPGKIEGLLRIVTAGSGGTARGELQLSMHLAAVTLTSAIGPSTATAAVNTQTASQRVELTFISGHASNTYTFRNAVMYRVA